MKRNRGFAYLLVAGIGLSGSVCASGLVGFTPPPGNAGNWSGLNAHGPDDSGARRGVPKGWILAGNAVNRYAVGTDSGQGAPLGHRFVRIRSNPPWLSTGTNIASRDKPKDEAALAQVPPFATVMQSFRADAYRGKRMRLSALLQTTEVSDAAGLWIRVEAQNGRLLAFDNMESRQLAGTTPWQRHDIVLDVPEEGATIAAGFLLAGSGEVKAADFQFEPVDASVPVTAPPVRSPEQTLPDAPANLQLHM